MDHQEQMLLAEVLENPADDMPRLIYADWLEERGDPRAEFIRVQCELEQTSGVGLKEQLRKREKELLLLYQPVWTRGLDRKQVPYLRFRRGFVDSVQTSLNYFRKVISRRFPLWPIQSLWFVSAPGELCALKATPALSRIRTLKFSSSKLGVKGIRQLVDCEILESLRELYLTSCELDSLSISLLADSPLILGLRTLMLGGNNIGDAGVASLVESAPLAHLEQLGVVMCHIGDSGAAALADSPYLPKVQTLRFFGNTVNEQSLSRLVARYGDGLLLH